jgi:hypothetical protein
VTSDEDIKVPTPWESFLAWAGQPRGYTLVRWLILRLLGVVYAFAFLGIVFQGPALLGSHGLTPVGTFVAAYKTMGATFWQLPTLFYWDASDTALATWAYVGLALSIAVALGYANLPMLLALWFIYGSYDRVGQTWWGFGWEFQLLETTLIAAVLAHPWDPRPLAPPPATTPIVLMRWLTFRIMLGAGLIKLRGNSCWTDLTCLDWHFETQPIPNPLSALFHHAPHWVHATGVVFNHIVEVVAPWFVFGPRRLRLIAGCLMAAFQGVLILSGNLSFLNWLTLIPVLACFDDDAILRILPRRLRDAIARRIPPRPTRSGSQLGLAIAVGLFVIFMWMPVFGTLAAGTQVVLATSIGIAALVTLYTPPVRRRVRVDLHQLLAGVFAALVIVKSWPVVDNLFFAKHQAMNATYDRLEIVNTYGAFGAVGNARYELVIEGTRDPDPATATWQAYELPCKPGPLDRAPCILGPYHRRLDWRIWFAAMYDGPSANEPWVIHLVWKLLDGDRTVRTLLAVDPFHGEPPTWVRIRRFRYHLEPFSSETWWSRDEEQLWLPPVSKDTPGLVEALAEYGWPSPSTH